jgi:hypothetical protein
MAIILTPPPVPAPEDPTSTAPPTLTVTYYQQLAAHFSEILDEVAAIIPRAAGPALDPRFVRTHLNIPIKFLGTVVASVEQVPNLRTAGKLDVDKGCDTLQLLDAFRTIRYKVAAFTEDLEYALNARQASLAVDALDSYDLAKSLIRDPNNAALTSWVDNMQADLGRRGPRPKKPASKPVPASPAPVSATAAPAQPEGWNG